MNDDFLTINQWLFIMMFKFILSIKEVKLAPYQKAFSFQLHMSLSLCWFSASFMYILSSDEIAILTNVNL